MTSSSCNRKNKLLKVVILGDGGVGKSCIMNRFVSNSFDSHSFHTVGVEFFNKDIEVDGENYTLQLWDTAGQERFKSLRTPFYRGTDICMLSYSIDDQKSFENLTMWRDEFIFYSGVQDAQQYPFLVVGNKVDLGEESRKVNEGEVEAWCEAKGKLPHIETSAKDAINVDKAFALAVERWNKLEEFIERSNDYKADMVDLRRHRGTKENTKSGCCS
ncbi:ras-related protein Rab-9B [Macrosteles quadrilineatus]|uniref:ras-related protein Rab-9B n=1 Tax=Macrosteles quadrilineatus TaxID=74068 RepID=UPI0023E1FCC7|nr:ras-related protein Rab-9B [Macrosteles quadrilineatus]